MNVNVQPNIYELCFYTSCSSDAPKNVSVSVSLSGVIELWSSVTLNCSSDANPPEVNYTWKRQIGKTKATVRSAQNYSYYTIDKIQPDQSGNYSCIVQNKIGQTESKPRLVIVQGNNQLFIHLPN